MTPAAAVSHCPCSYRCCCIISGSCNYFYILCKSKFICNFFFQSSNYFITFI